MLVLRGAPALSDFRLHKLERRLAAAIGRQVELYAEFRHFVELEQTLDQQEVATLERLLRYGPRLVSHQPTGELLLVVPRPGTISPWSSKATDIAHNCGLTKIRRIERGIAYWLDDPKASALAVGKKGDGKAGDSSRQPLLDGGAGGEAGPHGTADAERPGQVGTLTGASPAP